jgi:hypothetical protein
MPSQVKVKWSWSVSFAGTPPEIKNRRANSRMREDEDDEDDEDDTQENVSS